MRFFIHDSKFDSFGVYLNGELQKFAIEADDMEGWVKTEQMHIGWMSKRHVEKKKRYGKIHFVRMLDYDMSHYRAQEHFPNNKDKLVKKTKLKRK